MSELTKEQRAEILENVAKTVKQKFYDPQLRGLNWDRAVEQHSVSVVDAATAEEFELGISKLLGELKTSHVGFYHRALARATSKMALSATYAAFPVGDSERWIFQDVHEGGAAHAGGIQPGDVLLSVDGRSFGPPEHPIFPMGQTVELRVLTDGLQNQSRRVNVPAPKRKRNQLPYAQPAVVVHKRLNHDTGYVKISMYPGVVGVEVANEISEAIAKLNPIDRLVIDLRGNTGGGIGVLRVMSYLTPDHLSVGYSLNRKQLQQTLSKESFPVFDRIPASKLGLIPLVLKFARPQKPIMVRTEGLGAQPFHGRIVLLVNRHTASANEMLVAFAKEHGLATIVGEATPGRLLSGGKFKVGYDYWLALPVGAYHTAAGSVLEGNPIAPDVNVAFDPAHAREGRDLQLDAAIEVVSRL
jgi:carboxyl-terminal processing protease